MGLLTLVRHGQASFGADDYDVLSPTGHEQARALGAWLVAHDVRHATPPRTIRYGALRRHRETWESLAAGAGWSSEAGGHPEPVVDPDWDEFDFREVLVHHSTLTGTVVDPETDRDAFQAAFETATGHWITHAPAPEQEGGEAPYPEPFVDFVARAARALATAQASPGPTMVVTSGGVIATLAATLLAPDPNDAAAVGSLWDRLNTVIANTSVTRVLVGKRGARLLTFNEHVHLGTDLLTYR